MQVPTFAIIRHNGTCEKFNSATLYECEPTANDGDQYTLTWWKKNNPKAKFYRHTVRALNRPSSWARMGERL